MTVALYNHAICRDRFLLLNVSSRPEGRLRLSSCAPKARIGDGDDSLRTDDYGKGSKDRRCG